MKNAVKEITDIELNRRTFYLLEGMPINEMVEKILELKGYYAKQRDNTRIDIVAQKIGARKKRIGICEFGGFDNSCDFQPFGNAIDAV